MSHAARPEGSVHPTLAVPIVLALLVALAVAAPAAGQGMEEDTYSRFSAGVGLLNLQPLGSLATGPGWGLSFTPAWALDEGRLLRIKGDLRFGIYGRDTRRVCLSETVGCLIEVDVNTDYTSFYFGVGPELALRLGGPTLALGASLGVGGFAVTSSVEGTQDTEDEDLFRTDNFSEAHLAYSAGGELRIPVSAQASIAIGVHYLHNGEATYVPPGGVTLNTDGSVNVNEVTTDANQFAITLGVAFHPFVGWAEELEEDG